MQAPDTRKAPPVTCIAARAFELQRQTINVEARTVELAFSSETPVERWFGMEVLGHGAGQCRLGRMQNGGALLLNHETDEQIGVVESIAIGTDRVGRAVVRFGKSAQADEIFQDVVDGIRRHVSVGYLVHAWDVREGVGDAPSTYTATDWEPLEISIVSVPADPSVGIGRGLTDEQTSKLARAFGIVPAESRTISQPPVKLTRKESTMDKTPEQIAAEVRAAAQADAAKNTQAIIGLGRTYAHLGGERHAADYLQSGKSDPAEFQGLLLSKIGTAGNDTTRGEIGLTKKEARQFSILRAVRHMVNPHDASLAKAAAFEIECSKAAREITPRANSGLTIPMDVLLQRDMTVGTSTAGGNLVGTNLLAGSFIDMLRNRMAIQRLGATTLNGLVGDIAIPRQTGGATAYWVAESGAPPESAAAVDQVSMSPKTLGAFTDISRKLMLQSSVDVEALVRSDLARVIALAVDYAALYGTGSSNQPQGLKLQTGVNTKDFAANAPTFAEIVALETEIASDNADLGSMAYLVNAAGRGSLKTTEKATNTGMFIWEPGNTVNGYRTEVSNQVASNDYWFGNWSDLLLGFWSGLDILVDPYTGSTSGTVRIVALQDVDVAVRHGESFCRGNNTL